MSCACCDKPDDGCNIVCCGENFSQLPAKIYMTGVGCNTGTFPLNKIGNVWKGTYTFFNGIQQGDMLVEVACIDTAAKIIVKSDICGVVEQTLAMCIDCCTPFIARSPVFEVAGCCAGNFRLQLHSNPDPNFPCISLSSCNCCPPTGASGYSKSWSLSIGTGFGTFFDGLQSSGCPYDPTEPGQVATNFSCINGDYTLKLGHPDPTIDSQWWFVDVVKPCGSFRIMVYCGAAPQPNENHIDKYYYLVISGLAGQQYPIVYYIPHFASPFGFRCGGSNDFVNTLSGCLVPVQSQPAMPQLNLTHDNVVSQFSCCCPFLFSRNLVMTLQNVSGCPQYEGVSFPLTNGGFSGHIAGTPYDVFSAFINCITTGGAVGRTCKDLKYTLSIGIGDFTTGYCTVVAFADPASCNCDSPVFLMFNFTFPPQCKDNNTNKPFGVCPLGSIRAYITEAPA